MAACCLIRKAFCWKHSEPFITLKRWVSRPPVVGVTPREEPWPMSSCTAATTSQSSVGSPPKNSFANRDFIWLFYDIKESTSCFILTCTYAPEGRYPNLIPSRTQTPVMRVCARVCRHKQQDLSITCSLQLHANETLIGELADMTVIRNTLTCIHAHQSSARQPTTGSRSAHTQTQ